jgi:1-acyl-sn-glycerol-3-phosphate acyltransferase
LHWLRRLLEYLATYLGLFYLGLFLTGVTTYLLVAKPFVSPQRLRVRGQAGISRTFRWYLNCMCAVGWIQIDKEALDSLKNEGALIVAPNHPSMIDAVLMLASMPRGICLMKPSLLDHWFLSHGSQAAGYLADGSALGLVRMSIAAFERGEQLLIFPEGTRTVTPPINPLARTYALIAKQSKVPVQIVYISVNSAFLGKHWPMWRAPSLPVRYKITLGERFLPEGSVADILVKTEEQFTKHFGKTQA